MVLDLSRMGKGNFTNNVGFNLELEEWMRDGQKAARRVLHINRPAEKGRDCYVLVPGGLEQPS